MSNLRLVAFASVTVVILATVGYLFMNNGKKSESSPQTKHFYKTQSACESATNSACVQRICDYAPQGKTIEEVCGIGYRKGYWSAL